MSSSSIELGKLAGEKQVCSGHSSLQKLVSTVLSLTLEKPEAIRKGTDWNKAVLAPDEINYAAKDAAASLLVYRALTKKFGMGDRFTKDVPPTGNQSVSLMLPSGNEIVATGVVTQLAKCSLGCAPGVTTRVVRILEVFQPHTLLQITSNITAATKNCDATTLVGYKNRCILWKITQLSPFMPVSPSTSSSSSSTTASGTSTSSSEMMVDTSPSPPQVGKVTFTYDGTEHSGDLVDSRMSDGDCLPSILVDRGFGISESDVRAKIKTFALAHQDESWLMSLFHELVSEDNKDLTHLMNISDHCKALTDSKKKLHLSDFHLVLCCLLFKLNILVWSPVEPRTVQHVRTHLNRFLQETERKIDVPALVFESPTSTLVVAHVNKTQPLIPANQNHFMFVNCSLSPVPVGGLQTCLDLCAHTGVYKDIFHALKHLRVSLKHGGVYAFICAMRDAVLVANQEDMDRVLTVCERKGISPQFLSKAYLQARIRREAPPPNIMRTRLLAVKDTFKDVVDDKTKAPLFTAELQESFNQLLEHASRGCMSDPVGVTLYIKTGEDKDGLNLWVCTRGTNDLENYHQKVISWFRGTNLGMQSADTALRINRARWNIRAAIKNRPGTPNYFIYDLRLIGKINALTLRHDIYERAVYPDYVDPSFYAPTGEKFGCTALTSSFDRFKPKSPDRIRAPRPSTSMKYFADAIGWPTGPPLPVRTVDEMKLFKLLAPTFATGTSSLDTTAMALAWSAHVDGRAIFLKLPNHLDTHFRIHLKANNRLATMSGCTEQYSQLLSMLYLYDDSDWGDERDERIPIQYVSAPRVPVRTSPGPPSGLNAGPHPLATVQQVLPPLPPVQRVLSPSPPQPIDLSSIVPAPPSQSVVNSISSARPARRPRHCRNCHRPSSECHGAHKVHLCTGNSQPAVLSPASVLSSSATSNMLAVNTPSLNLAPDVSVRRRRKHCKRCRSESCRGRGGQELCTAPDSEMT